VCNNDGDALGWVNVRAFGPRITPRSNLGPCPPGTFACNTPASGNSSLLELPPRPAILTGMSPKPKLRWYQFSLRTLLVFVTLCAIPCSWYAVKKRQAKHGREAAAVEKLGGRIGWTEPSGPEWLRALFGDDFFTDVLWVDLSNTACADTGLECLEDFGQLERLSLDRTFVTDAGLEHVKGLGRLKHLSVSGTLVTDAGLEHVQGLGQLVTLSLGNTKATDSGLERLRCLAQLEELDLGGTAITDAGLESLENLRQLKTLRLTMTRVTDAGLTHLQDMAQLQELYLGGICVTDTGLMYLKGLTQLQQLSLIASPVSDDGIEKLQQALPKCKITR
jgi:hypothetical protein